MANEVAINIKATDNTSSTAAAIGKNVTSMASKIGDGVVKLGETIGGEVGEMVTKFGDGFKKISDAGAGTWTKLAVGGGVMAGLGVALQSFASAGVQAEAQLKQAVDNTGDSFDDYEKQISAAESAGAKFGDTNSQVAGALQTLVQGTGDTKIALQDLNIVYDVAAARHISLADAASLIAKIYAGNTKVLKQFGIDMTVTAGNTDEATAAINALAQKVNGQANASVNNFQGRVAQARAEVTNWAEAMAEKTGPALTYIGTATGIAASIVDVFSARTARMSAAAREAAAAARDVAVANETLAVSEAAAAAGAEAEGASMLLALGPIGLAVAGFVALTYGIDKLVSMNEDKALGSLGKLSTALTGLGAAVKADGDAFGDQSTKVAAAALQSSGLADTFSKSKISLAQLTGAVGMNADAFKAQIEEWKKSGLISDTQVIALGGAWNATQKAITGNKELDKALSDLGVTTTDTSGDISNMAKAVGTMTDAADAAAKAGDVVAQAFKEIQNPAEDVYKATLQTSDAIQGLSDQVAAAKKDQDKYAASLDTTTASGRKNTESVLGIIDGINQYILKSQQSGATAAQTESAVAKMNQSLLDTETKAGLGKQGLQGLIDQYENNPKTFIYQITVDAENALSQLTTLQGKMAYVNALKTSSPGAYAGLFEAEHPGSGTQYAHGGTVGAATGGNRSGVIQWAEHGREMAKLPTGSYVMSNPDTETALNSGKGSSGGGVNITFAPPGGSLFEQAMMAWLRKAVRVTGGGDVQKAFGG